MPFSDALIVDYVGRSIGRSRCDPWESACFVMTEERPPKVEGLTPEELAEKQRMNIMGLSPNPTSSLPLPVLPKQQRSSKFVDSQKDV